MPSTYDYSTLSSDPSSTGSGSGHGPCIHQSSQSKATITASTNMIMPPASRRNGSNPFTFGKRLWARFLPVLIEGATVSVPATPPAAAQSRNMRAKILEVDTCRPLGTIFRGNRAVRFDQVKGEDAGFRRTRSVLAVLHQRGDAGADRVDHVVDLGAHKREPRPALEVMKPNPAVLMRAWYVGGRQEAQFALPAVMPRSARSMIAAPAPTIGSFPARRS